MIRLIGWRLLAVPITLLGVGLMTYLIIAASPFDPVQAYVGAESLVGREGRAEIEKAWGLDEPLGTQMVRWVTNVAQGDLGRSIMFRGRPVSDIILERAGPTLVLVGTAFAMVLVGSIVLGVLAAAFRDSPVDGAIRALAYFNVSAPSFWVALLAIYIFSVQTGWLPAAGMRDPREPDAAWVSLRHLVLPASFLALSQLAWFTLFVRNAMVETLREEYVRYGRAQGVRESALVLRHVLPNALLPFISLAGVHIGEILGGAVLIESIFAWPGLGLLARDAALSVDVPLLLAITLLSSLAIILGNLTADVCYRLVDPRIREATG